MAVAMMDLKNALRQRLLELGMTLKFGQCSLEKNIEDEFYNVIVDGQKILAEGSQRGIVKRDLQLPV
jgi:hypothetical protein